METLAYLYAAEANDAIATKRPKKSRKKGNLTQAVKPHSPTEIAFPWMP